MEENNLKEKVFSKLNQENNIKQSDNIDDRIEKIRKTIKILQAALAAKPTNNDK